MYKSILIYVLTLQIIVAGEQECKNSACVLLGECDLALRLLKDGHSAFNFLKNYHCGFDDKVPKFCCHDIILNKNNKQKSQDVPELKSYEELENKIALLPNETICGIQYTDRIYNGIQCQLDEHPWMTLLEYTKRSSDGTITKKFYCGGVLISANYVLTAAHCVKGAITAQPHKLTNVRLGEWDTSSDIDCHYGDCAQPVLDVAIEEIISHEEYNESDTSSYNDIALLRLKRRVKFSDFVKPICLPFADDLMYAAYEDRFVEVAGWGSMDNISPNSNVKLKARVPLFKNDDCNRVYNSHDITIKDTQICAGGGRRNENSCKGDSGGGLFGQSSGTWFLFGIVSFGPRPCGISGYPTVYSRVTAYRDWILSNLKL